MSTFTQGWETELRESYRSVPKLLAALELTAQDVADDNPGEVDLAPEFPFLVPRAFASRMKIGDPNDPLLRQVLPLQVERVAVPGLTHDPLLESQFTRGPLIQKYDGRLLVLTTGACMINCRYCFRRDFPYASHTLKPREIKDTVREIGSCEAVEEVILSGGDPWLLSDQKLADLIEALLVEAPRVKTIRFHTRVPIVMPSRTTDSLLSLLEGMPQSVVVVVHSNHPNEIDEAVLEGFQRIGEVSTAVLNQSVLLSGVNDSSEVLADLSWKLFEGGVLPYYLHMPDKVAGTQQFMVKDVEAKAIVLELQTQLPGYLVPRLVREEPGKASKTLLPLE